MPTEVCSARVNSLLLHLVCTLRLLLVQACCIDKAPTVARVQRSESDAIVATGEFQRSQISECALCVASNANAGVAALVLRAAEHQPEEARPGL